MVLQDTCISGGVFVNELSIKNIQGFLQKIACSLYEA